MKKFVALLLAMLLVLANVAALAEEPATSELDKKVEIVLRGSGLTPSASTPAVQKEYIIEDGLSYSENLSFAVTCTQAPTGVVPANAPKISIGTKDAYTYAVGTDDTDMIAINFPAYTVAGTYTYTVTETPGNVQGVTYSNKTINVKVYVEYKDGVLTSTANVWIGDNEVKNKKYDKITNTMEVGDLKVEKKIDGNLADPQRTFKIEVVFTKSTGKTVKTPIIVTTTETVTGEDGTSSNKTTGTADKTKITAEELDNAGTTGVKVTLTLKGDEYVTFENIPYGVNYTVVETSETTHLKDNDDTTQKNNANDPTAYYVTGEVKDDAPGSITKATDTVTIKNEKRTDIPTGIALDTVPYILIMVIALAGVALASRKREEY